MGSGSSNKVFINTSDASMKGAAGVEGGAFGLSMF